MGFGNGFSKYDFFNNFNNYRQISLRLGSEYAQTYPKQSFSQAYLVRFFCIAIKVRSF